MKIVARFFAIAQGEHRNTKISDGQRKNLDEDIVSFPKYKTTHWVGKSKTLYSRRNQKRFALRSTL